jgi:iron complex transport system permease protein
MKLRVILAVALSVAMLLSLFAGHVWISPAHWFGGDLQSLIIVELRLPRAFVGAIVGAALGGSGAVMQGYLRNPLADPGLFGISACAALGAVISLYFGVAASPLILAAFALAGAGGGAALLMIVAGRSGGDRKSVV